MLTYCSKKPPDMTLFGTDSRLLLCECTPLIKYLMAPPYRKHRWVASGVFARVAEILLKWRDRALSLDIQDSNLATWFIFATNTCADVLAAGLELFESKAKGLVELVSTLCHLVVLSLGAYCAAVLGRRWQPFPHDAPQDAHLFTPHPQDCVSAVVAVRAASLLT